MAKNNNFATQDLSGCVGDIVFCQRNGKSYCRKRSQYTEDSLSPASRESGSEFSKAVKAAKAIRVSLNGIWPPAKDETANYRLNKVVYAALRADDAHRRGERVFTAQALQLHMKGFRYNARATQTIDNADIIRQEDGSIRLELSACWQHSLRIPKAAKYVQLLAVALDMDLVNNTCLQSVTTAACIPLGDAAATLILPAQAMPSTATIVMLQLRFLQEATGVQTVGPMSSEQAFVAGVLAPAAVPVDNRRTVKVPRITRKIRPAVDILRSMVAEKKVFDGGRAVRRIEEEDVIGWKVLPTGDLRPGSEMGYIIADRE